MMRMSPSFSYKDAMDSMRVAVEDRRRVLGLSLERTAEVLDVHRNTLWRIESGEADPKISVLNRLLLTIGADQVSFRDGRFNMVCGTDSWEELGGFCPHSDEYMRAEIGRFIRENRCALDMSQEYLAELADLHRNTVGKIERGEVDLTVATLFRLYAVLSVDVLTVRAGKLVTLQEGK